MKYFQVLLIILIFSSCSNSIESQEEIKRREEHANALRTIAILDSIGNENKLANEKLKEDLKRRKRSKRHPNPK